MPQRRSGRGSPRVDTTVCETSVVLHSTSRRAALGAFLAALALAGPSSAAPPKQGLFVPGRSLGGVRLEATRQQVRAAWGRSFGVCRGCAHRTWYFNYRPFEPQGVGVTFQGGHAAALFTLWSPPGWRTTNGLRIGDDVGRVTLLYGPLPRVECGEYYALNLIENGTFNLFYILGQKVWGFGLSRRAAPPCR